MGYSAASAELLTRLLVLLVLQYPGGLAALANPAPCIACRADFDVMRKGYSASQWRDLTRGEIVTSQTEAPQSDGSVDSNIESSAVIPGPASLVWSVITDPAARYRSNPEVKVRIVREDGQHRWVAYHLHILFFVNIRYQVIDTLDPERGLATWELDKSARHDISGTAGSWQIASLPSGQGTLVRYRAWIDTGRPVPRFVTDLFIKRSLRRILRDVRNEVQRRALHDAAGAGEQFRHKPEHVIGTERIGAYRYTIEKDARPQTVSTQELLIQAVRQLLEGERPTAEINIEDCPGVALAHTQRSRLSEAHDDCV